MNIFIYSFPYNENSGGVIALHRLCHIINLETEHKAYLVSHAWPYSVWKKFRYLFKNKPLFVTKDGWNTPVWTRNKFPEDAVVIYPEVVNGNPLGIKHVVRWLLHQPGFHTGQIHYGENELYFSYSSGFSYKVKNNSKLSNNILNVRYTPTDIYFENSSIEKDIDISYLIRKGKDKKIIHPEGSICVDGLSHIETAEIFKRSKKFISYDTYTAYSHFAVLCGCESIVVPDEKVDLSDWYPKEIDRFGVAYGFGTDQIKFARDTKKDLIDKLLNENLLSIESVKTALEEILYFFE